MSMDMGEFGLPSFVAFLPSFAKVLKKRKNFVILHENQAIMKRFYNKKS